MSRLSPVVRTLDGLLEFGWLFIIVGVPTFFNVRDYRVFEPDKIVLLRNTILAMIVVWMIKALYLAPAYLAGRFASPKEQGGTVEAAHPAARVPLSTVLS